MSALSNTVQVFDSTGTVLLASYSGATALEQGVNFADTGVGDIVKAGPGDFLGDLNITSSMTITGAGSHTMVDGISHGYMGDVTVAYGVNNVTIQNLTINAATNELAGVYLGGNNNNINVVHNTIIGHQTDTSVNAQDLLTGGGENNLTISNNVFAGQNTNMIYINGQVDVGVASNNININHNDFTGNSLATLVLDGTGSIVSNTFEQNLSSVDAVALVAGVYASSNVHDGGDGLFNISTWNADYQMDRQANLTTSMGSTGEVDTLTHWDSHDSFDVLGNWEGATITVVGFDPSTDTYALSNGGYIVI